MRRVAAVFALVLSLFGLPIGFLGGFDWAGIMTFGVFWIVLVASAISALAGGDLTYLAVAYGIFIGMNLASSLDVIRTFLWQKSAGAAFGVAVAAAAITIGIVGLLLTLVAKHKERVT